MKTKLSIYIHIPFCVKKCLYCDFLSAVCDKAERASYLEALIEEISYSLRGDDDLWDNYEVGTIFFGGGTPSTLTGGQINKIMSALKERFVICEDAEITMECNPGTVTEENMSEYIKAGINRLSIGLQSANDEELKRLGRIHNFKEFDETIKIARKLGLHNINVDIMSALPGQSLESYEETLKTVLSYKPEHISSYSLIIEEGTPFFKRFGDSAYDMVDEFDTGDDNSVSYVMGLPDLPDEDTERQMYYKTDELLSNNGYHRYEISNYSLENMECRHNSGYWTGVDYLGFGLGAASYYKGVRYNNTTDMIDYIQKCHKLTQEKNPNPYFDEEDDKFDYLGQLSEEGFHEAIHPLTQNEKIEEYMFLGLRMMKGISKQQFYVNFGRKIEDVFGEVLDKLLLHKLIIIDGDVIALTNLGIDVSNQVLANFLL